MRNCKPISHEEFKWTATKKKEREEKGERVCTTKTEYVKRCRIVELENPVKMCLQVILSVK